MRSGKMCARLSRSEGDTESQREKNQRNESGPYVERSCGSVREIVQDVRRQYPAESLVNVAVTPVCMKGRERVQR